MNSIEDEGTLKDAFASLAGTVPAEAAGTHPEPGRIYDAVRGKLPPDELREVVEHLGACPDCAEAWRLAAAFEEEALASAPAAAHASTSRPFPRLVAVAATVLVALLGAGLWWTTFRAPEAPPTYRAAGDAEILSLLAEGEPLDRDEPVLRWEVAPPGAPEGTTYRLVVTTSDPFEEPVAEETGLEEPRYEIPPDALADLPGGTDLLWRVEALTPGGRRIASPTFVTPLR